MAAYRRVDDFSHLRANCPVSPGSAPGPTLGNEYGKPLPFNNILVSRALCIVAIKTQHDPFGVESILLSPKLLKRLIYLSGKSRNI